MKKDSANKEYEYEDGYEEVFDWVDGEFTGIINKWEDKEEKFTGIINKWEDKEEKFAVIYKEDLQGLLKRHIEINNKKWEAKIEKIKEIEFWDLEDSAIRNKIDKICEDK